MEIHNMRREYQSRELHRRDLEDNPLDQFQHWFGEAIASEIPDPNAMALATATAEGRPSCRMVLMKHFDDNGFVFYTNYNSRKARELQQNPYASLNFYWNSLERQVLIEGKVEKASREEAIIYFTQRPRGSQLSSAISNQDAIIDSREVLEEARSKLDTQYHNQEVPCPSFWGGFRLRPTRFEFWQGRSDRLHDRFLYILENGKWNINRLAP